MLEALVGQGLPTPPIVDGLVLVEVPYQDPLQPAEGQLTQLCPAGDVHHADLVDNYPARRVFPPFDRFVGEMVDGQTSHVVGRQVGLGQNRHSLALVPQELDEVSREA